jgi:hypothetical protein
MGYAGQLENKHENKQNSTRKQAKLDDDRMIAQQTFEKFAA